MMLYYLSLKLELKTPHLTNATPALMCKIMNKVNDIKSNWIEGIFGSWCKSIVKKKAHSSWI